MIHSRQATTERILDVAEALFAEAGLDRVSVRDITGKAKVNIAAVSYHFGGKSELIAAVFARRIRPVNQARLAALMEIKRSHAANGASVERIVDAFIRPAVTFWQSDEKGSRAFAKLFGRCLAETRPEIEALLQKQFKSVARLMETLLARALPELPREEIFWRMKFTFGALHHWMLTRDKFIPEWVDNRDTEGQMKKLIAYSSAGFKAA